MKNLIEGKRRKKGLINGESEWKWSWNERTRSGDKYAIKKEYRMVFGGDKFEREDKGLEER